MFDYPVMLSQDGDSWLATFPDVPEAITFGKTQEKALAQAVDALETALSFYIDNRLPLPAASASFYSLRVSAARQGRVFQRVRIPFQ